MNNQARKIFLIFGIAMILSAIATLISGGFSLPSKFSGGRYHFQGTSLILIAASQLSLGGLFIFAYAENAQKAEFKHIVTICLSFIFLAVAVIQADLY